MRRLDIQGDLLMIRCNEFRGKMFQLEEILQKLRRLFEFYCNCCSDNLRKQLPDMVEKYNCNMQKLDELQKLIERTEALLSRMEREYYENDIKEGVWRKPTKDQCGNCHATLTDGDKYCRICGTKVGEGEYAPYLDTIQCIYGPMPKTREHECKGCGYKWTTCLMVDKERYCPHCGYDTEQGSKFIE